MKIKVYHEPDSQTLYVNLDDAWYPFGDHVEPNESIIDLAFDLALSVRKDPDSWGTWVSPHDLPKRLVLSLNIPDSTQPTTA